MANVLVVEDDPTMNEILVEVLQDEGHQVRYAFSGEEALEQMKNWPVELVVSDVRLPGIDGVETLSRFKKLKPSLKTIVLTGYARADAPVRAIRLKVDDYLFKPFGLAYFVGCVNRVLASEEERQAKLGLFEKVFAYFGNSKDDALDELVSERHEAYRGLYIGARSGHLTQSASLAVYNLLDSLEPQFRGLLNDKNAEAKDIRDLQLRYHEILDSSAELEPCIEMDSGHEVNSKDFKRLYTAMKTSQISADDLMYAPLLRTTPDERFETLPDLLALKRRLWEF